VEVASQVGKGSTFRVYLPALTKAPPVRPESPLLEVQRGKEMILLVDDETALRDMVALGLQLHGYRVLEAANGQEAIQAWDDHAGEIDLLFTDMRMPGGMTGMDLFERLKQRKATLKGVISSGYSEEIVKAQGLMTPGLAFLPKPYNVRTLAGTVRNCLDEAGPYRGSTPFI
jgi:CheY-like chemotaxis protein